MATRSTISKRPLRPTSAPARRKGIPLSPLAQQMLQDMQLVGLSDRTHESYLRAVRKFAQWLKKSPIWPPRTICDVTCCSSRTISTGRAIPSKSPTPV